MAATDPVATINSTSSALDSASRSDVRRRQGVAAAKKSELETVPNVGNSGVAINHFVTDPGTNVSRAMKGDTGLERPRDSPQFIKGKIAASTVSPRRRKTISRHDKPVWLTVLSIITKNCLLVMGLYMFGRLIWKWSDQLNGTNNMPFAALDLEEQVSDLKSSLKKTTKMIQFQLEVVDQRISSESDNVRMEISKTEERIVSYELELKKLEAQSRNLENSLSDLQGKGLLSKEEFEKFFTEFKSSLHHPGRDGELITLDEMRNHAREIVRIEMEKHAADGLGRVDYALASGGARVIRHSEAYLRKGFWGLVKGGAGVHADAQKMLRPSFGEPGQCFPLKGSSGFVEVKLRTAIIPDSITLEHVAKSVAYNRSTAPKDCKISAWLEGPGAEAVRMLAKFTYDLEKSNLQSFGVEPGAAVNVVRLEFSSNHGSSSNTCIYRLRVHGSEHVSP